MPSNVAFDPLKFRDEAQEFKLKFGSLKTRGLFGKNLKVLARARGLTVNALGNAAHVDDTLISRISNVSELGKKGTGISYMGALSLARVLDVSLESMLTKDFSKAIENAIGRLDESET